MTAPTRVDPHVKVLDERVAERAKARGIDVLVYAPHFERLPSIRERAERFSDEELLVVPGREVFTGSWRNRRHVLGVGLTDPVPDFISLEGALDAFDEQAAATLVPHPGYLTIGLPAAVVRANADRVDAVETYNPKHLPGDNRRARELAAGTGLPAFGSSYAHFRGTVGEVWTEFEADIDSEADLVAAFREGAPRAVYHRDGPGHAARRVAELAHVGWENSWKKVDRVLLSGMEPTHPGHLAYDGAFDDVRVY
jgi:predicted metal-dependent phosphoesterase TrpH